MDENLNIEYIAELPDESAFYVLFDTTGWNQEKRSAEQLSEALKTSWYFVSVYSGDTLVGCGRILSDGCLHAFVTEMIVSPDYQKRGIGTQILLRLVREALNHGINDIQLFCAAGKEDFYLKNGFEKRPNDAPGMQYRVDG